MNYLAFHMCHMGKIEQVDRQWIDTKFLFVFGVIMIPVESSFCVKEPRGRVNRLEIKLRGKSIMAAYARMVVGILAAGVSTLSIVFILDPKGDRPWFLIIPSFMLIAAYLYCLLCLGRLSRLEVRRRRILGELTGHKADPAILPEFTHGQTLATLRERAKLEGIDSTPEHWERTVPEPKTLPLLFTLAMYEKQLPDGEPWKRLAEDFWKMLEQQGHGRP